MKQVFFTGLIVLSVVTLFNVCAHNSFKSNVIDLTMSGIEALTRSESGNFGCGRAAYQWKDKGLWGNVNFVKCQLGCPEGEGRDPQYMNC